MTRQRGFPGLLAGGVALVAAACGGDGSAPGTGPATAEPPSPSPASTPVAGAALSWPDWPNTDFSTAVIDLGEVIRGCPVRDCIPALDAPGAASIESARTGEARFAPVASVPYPPAYPVAVLRVDEAVRGYPLHILTWHEIVNDRLGGVPVAVTFCPLCNTAIAFERTVDGEVLDFGVSGNLRNSDLIMWDRQTESWWQQATGEGIVGRHAGARLKPLSLPVVSYADFAARFPGADVLTEDTGLAREYGINPYGGYDTPGTRPFLFNGAIDPRLDGLERVVGIGRGSEEPVAVPFSVLAQVRVANVEAGPGPVVVFWSPGTVSALGASTIERAEDVGAATAYEALAAGEKLTFFAGPEPGVFMDRETRSTWDTFGTAVDGPLAGTELTPVVHTTEFWFAWAAFRPETRIWRPD